MVIHQFPLRSGWSQADKHDLSVELGYVLTTSEDKKEIISFVDTIKFGDKKDPSLILYVKVHVFMLIGRKTRRIPLKSLGEDPLQQQCTFTIDIRVPPISITSPNR